MGVLLRGGRLIGPSFEPGGTRADLVVRNGVVEAMGADAPARPDDQIIDCKDRFIASGLVDLWCRLGEPGYEYREDLDSARRAAAAGGYVAVCAVPDTKPINDTRAVTELIQQRARSAGTRVWPMAALTRGLAGESLAELGELADAGVVAACTGDAWLSDAGLARRGYEYARTFDLPVVSKPVDATLAAGGVAHEGVLATRLGLAGVPVEAETVALARDLELAALTGARLIASHLSSARAVELIAAAKARGTDVIATVSATHLLLDESACATYDPVAKLVPPLRSASDREALVRGLREGVIDCVVSDHDPKSDVDKDHEFADAKPGAVGLELALSAVFELVNRGELDLARAIDSMSLAPRRALGKPADDLAVGAVADLCVIGRNPWRVSPQSLLSRSKNTPLSGRSFDSRVCLTMVEGEVVYQIGGDM